MNRPAEQLTYSEIAAALDELLYFKIIHISGDILEQKRMVRDAEIRNKRAYAGKKGGNASKGNAAKEEILLEQNSKQNSSKSVSKEPSKTPSKNEEFASDLLASCAPAFTPPSVKEENKKEEKEIEDESKGKGVQGENHQKTDGSKISAFVELWNNTCPNLPGVKKLTQARRDKIRARLKDEPELEVWEEVFLKIQASSFCNGDNIRRWTASFDWITANAENYVKVLEGNYDRTSKQQGAGAAGPSGAAPEIDWSAEERL